MATDAQIDDGQGMLPGPSASTPLTQPPSREVHDHESGTSEANLRSTQESTAIKVMSTCGSRSEDDRTQSAATWGDPSWDKIPILSLSYEHSQENDRIGILSHDGDPKDGDEEPGRVRL